MRATLLAATVVFAFALGASGCASPKDAPPPAASAAFPAPAAAAPVAAASPHPGEAVYKARCAACHDNPETKAPTRATLGRLTPGRIHEEMLFGKMIAQASGLSNADLSYVADYISQATTDDDSWLKTAMCPADRRTPKLDEEPTVSTFGFDLKNKRALTYEQAGLKADDFGKLDVAWAMGFPNVMGMRGQPSVVGNTLFVPVGENKNRVYAIDVSNADKPCVQWKYDGTRNIRTGASYGVRKDGRKVVIVGDMGAVTTMLDAKTGEKLWETKTGLFDGSVSTGTPVLVGDTVYAPSSQFEIVMAQVDAYVCCKIHGGITAVDANTGKIVWQTGTMEDAKPLKDRGDGQMLWGPAGAPIWTSPAIDLKRNRLYVGTGEANSFNPHKNTDALMAFDLTSGKILWSHQATANDVYNEGCDPRSKPLPKNCATDTVYRDVDFGASFILATDTSGRDLVIGGQKSGTVWAMDPDTGEVVWRRDIGTGSTIGGIHWGIAADDTRVYAPIAEIGGSIPGQVVPPDLKPGLYAVNLKDGSIDWKFEVAADCTAERKKFTPQCSRLIGLSSAPTIIGDYVLAGSLDGRVYVVEKKTGKLVQTLDTARDFETVNGIKGNGGAIDNASIMAANGMVFVNSGYGMWNQGAGNVMVAFRPKR